MNSDKKVTIIGGGLAGCEAAWQVAEKGVQVELYEMRPHQFSPAHESDLLGELVCSNSLRSNSVDSAVGLLKEEMRRLNSILIKQADQTTVPAGSALAVDRELFAKKVTRLIEAHPNITLKREEVEAIPDNFNNPIVIATGPLTSEKLSEQLQQITGNRLAFYDAIAPIIDADSLDYETIYRKSRWDDENPGDYLNCPFSKEEYEHFYTQLCDSETVPLKPFEEVKYFEGCLPIEVMAARGQDTLRFGPMKPVGLAHPVTGVIPYAVVQLRAENNAGTMYNMVGFQTKLSYLAQKKVFRLIPGLNNAEFLRLGSIHRNSFICAPDVLDYTLQVKKKPNMFIAGQLSGVEGYVESIAMGLLAGINIASFMQDNKIPEPPPVDTAIGALLRYLIESDPRHFQPTNVNFGLFPPLQKKMKKRDRGQFRSVKALESLNTWVGML